MERTEIADVLKRHHGSKSEVARRARVSACAVSMWLRGGPSAHVGAVAKQYARELLATEAANKAA